MSVIKEYWRTSAIIIALIVILALLVYTPPPGERSRFVSNPPDQKTIAGFVLPPKNGTCYLSVGLIYHVLVVDRLRAVAGDTRAGPHRELAILQEQEGGRVGGHHRPQRAQHRLEDGVQVQGGDRRAGHPLQGMCRKNGRS